MITIKAQYNSANIMLPDDSYLDEATRKQIYGFLNHPAFGKSYIAIMPDCHYGAGRVLSRSKAKKELSLEDARKSMEEKGIYTTSLCKETLDEVKGAYKDKDMIINAISETVDIHCFVKPIYNFKSK
jgi:RNA-splicing ligase RtcB